MAKRLQCYHPEVGDQLEPPFVVFGVANAEVGPLYCGLYRGFDWFEGASLHPAGDQSRWAFEFAGPIPSGAGYTLWIGELSDSQAMLTVYPLSVFVPFVAAQLIVKYPLANRILPANHILSYGNTATPLNQHTLNLGGMAIPGTALRNTNGRFVVQHTAAVAGTANATINFRNSDAPMPSMVNLAVRIREVNPLA